MVAIVGRLSTHGDRRRVHAVQQQRDEARRIRFEREPRHIVHKPDLLHICARVGRVHWLRFIHRRLRFLFPLRSAREALLQIAHAGQILIEPRPILRPDAGFEAAGLIGDGIHDALAKREPTRLGLHLFLRAGYEHFAEHRGGLLFRWNQHASARPGKAALPLRNVHTQGQRRKPRLIPQALGRILVERNRVAKTAVARMGSGGQEAVVRRMPGVHVRVHNTREHGEIVAMTRKMFQIW